MNSDGTVKSEQNISRFGNAANIGDLDEDGVTDLAVGAPSTDGGTEKGGVHILFLNTDGTVKGEQEISDTAGNFTGPIDDGDHFGADIANIGDLDGDGITDLAVGATYDDDGGVAQGANRGAVYILFMNMDGTVKNEQKISSTEGNFTGILQTFDNFGQAVSDLGDLDGDGVEDIAVGSVFDDGPEIFFQAGAIWILFLNTDGTEKSSENNR